MVNIVLFGAPGCGKGTQAARIKEKYNINHISTGEVIRGEIARGTELGKSMQSYIESGRLAPDSIVIGMIRNYLKEHRDAAGNIFDGFPRTTAQAEEFDRILADPIFGLDRAELDKIVAEGRITGLAEKQTVDFLRDYVYPVLDANKDLLGGEATVNV